MAAVGDSINVEKFHRMCTQLFHFRLPVTKPTTDFKASFKNSMNNEETINLIEKLTLSRSDLCMALSTTVPLDAKLSAVDNYLPHIYLLMNTLHNQVEPVTFDKNICFEWRGAMTGGDEHYKSADVVFEVMMVLHTKAVLHNNLAKELVEDNPLSFVTEAGKHLLAAASIMSFLFAQLESGPWGNRSFSPKMPNPVEINPRVCLSLSTLFKGAAQAMATTKALNTDTTPALIKARLAVSVTNAMKLSLESIAVVPNAAMQYSVLMAYLGVQREFFSAVTLLFLAQSNADKTEMGLAIAYCAAAKRCIAEQPSPIYVPAQNGLPRLVGAHAQLLGPAVALLHTKIDAISKHAEQENRFIYFMVIPTTLPEPPAEACVMVPPKFEEPAYSGPPVVISYKAPKGMISSIFSSFMGSSTEPAASPAKPAAAASVTTGPAPAVDPNAAPPAIVPGAAPQYPYSAVSAPPSHDLAQQQADEAYARQLQAQYNNDPAAQPPQQQQQYQQPPIQYQQQAQPAYASAPPFVPNNGVSYPKL